MAKILRAIKPWGILGVVTGMVAMGRANAVVKPPPPSPEDGDTFELYAGDQQTYDSNLYRLPSSVTAAATPVSPNASRADTFNTASLGGEGQLLLRRQVLDLDLQVDENRFAKNDSLNNTSGDGKLRWNWVVGSALSGQLGADYNRGLAAFAETLYQGRDFVATTQYNGNLRYQAGPHWAVYGGANDSRYTHTAAAVRYNDLHTKSGDAGLEFDAGLSDTFAFDYRYTNGYYAEEYDLNNILLNRDYREDTVRFLVNYALTDKTTSSGYVGYIRRDYREAQLGHFAGDIWRISVEWHPTDKTRLVAAGWHELHSYSANEADYFVSHGVSVSPGWNASEKLTLSGILSFEDQNYIPSSTSALSLGARTDKISGEQLNILYQPRANLFFNVFFRSEQRKSTLQRFHFNDELVNASVTFRFW